MTSIKNILKSLALGVMLSSPAVFASDFPIETSINDEIGDANGGYPYEIERMDIKWAADDTITVNVHTNFVEYNNERYGGNHKNIVFGDLLIGTNGQSNPFDYAFVLTEGRTDNFSNTYKNRRGNYIKRKDDKQWTNGGTLTQIDSTQTSEDVHGSNYDNGAGEVMAGSEVVGGTAVSGDWTVNNYGRVTNKTDVISFNFNVGDINAFQTATQLAFSWAMTCANDVVEHVVAINRPDGGVTKVPEPTSILLMLSALVFMVNSRNKKAN